MSIFDALPLLEGWELISVNIARELERERRARLKKIEEKGWLFSLNIATFDAYASIELVVDGKFFGEVIIEEGHASGSYMPSNSYFWISTYQRPIPASTAGLYLAAFAPVIPIPYNKTVELYGMLTEDSTQTESAVSVGVDRFKITDEPKFIESYRKVFGTVPGGGR